MSRVQTLLENEEVQNLLENNSELLEEATQDFDGWYDVMVDFIAENIDEFLDETIEETYRNVYTFATFGTAQYLSEVSHTYGKKLETAEILKEQQEHEFV